MEIIQALKNIGLNEKEAKVYLALLESQKATAYTLAKKSGLKKPTTYVILESLMIKGIANKIPRAKTMQYTAIGPEQLFSMSERKFEYAKKVLPELKALHKGKEYKPKISFYEGIKGIKEVYKKIIREMKGKEVVGFYAHAKDTPPELYEYWNQWTKERRKKKIKVRGITSRDATNKEWLKASNLFLGEFKGLPKDVYDNNASIEVYDNYIVIVSSRHLQATVIDNPDIANTVRQVFNILWKKLVDKE